jgi:hypothetical protein
LRIARGAEVGITAAIASAALLLWSYPYSAYGVFNYSHTTTAAAYVLLALLVGLVGALARVLMQRSPASPLRTGIVTGLVFFVGLVVMSVVLGPLGVGVSVVALRGHFFSEWEFVTFIADVALPLAILIAGFIWWVESRRARVTSVE